MIRSNGEAISLFVVCPAGVASCRRPVEIFPVDDRLGIIPAFRALTFERRNVKKLELRATGELAGALRNNS